MKSYYTTIALCLIASCLVISCASLPTGEDAADYADQIQRLEARLAADADDTDALRDLGVIYVRTNQFAQAQSYLQRAYQQDTQDPATRFFYAMTLEKMGRDSQALSLYQTYTDLPHNSRYRQLMSGRYRWVAGRVAQQDIQARMLLDEANLPAASPEAVAVYPLVYLGADENYAMLGRGLSELVTTDLKKVERLQVLERARLQALLAELKLAESDVMDQSTAPRAGRLLGAGRVVGGSYDVLPGDEMRVDASSWQTETRSSRRLDTESEALANWFRLGKELVFEILQEMNVELTPEEREEINRAPTNNLQAFLAYSRGLLEDDGARYGAAAGFFRQAQALDPGFAEAAESAEAAEGAVATEGGAGAVASEQAGQTIQDALAMDLVGNRLINMRRGVSVLHQPGECRDCPPQNGQGDLKALPPPPNKKQ